MHIRLFNVNCLFDIFNYLAMSALRGHHLGFCRGLEHDLYMYVTNKPGRLDHSAVPLCVVPSSNGFSDMPAITDILVMANLRYIFSITFHSLALMECSSWPDLCARLLSQCVALNELHITNCGGADVWLKFLSEGAFPDLVVLDLRGSDCCIHQVATTLNERADVCRNISRLVLPALSGLHLSSILTVNPDHHQFEMLAPYICVESMVKTLMLKPRGANILLMG